DEAGRARADHLLVDDGLAHDVGALAAVLARPPHREVAGVVHLALPGLGPGDAAPVRRPFHRVVAPVVLRAVALEPGADFALEGELLERVGQIHRADP